VATKQTKNKHCLQIDVTPREMQTTSDSPISPAAENSGKANLSRLFPHLLQSCAVATSAWQRAHSRKFKLFSLATNNTALPASAAFGAVFRWPTGQCCERVMIPRTGFASPDYMRKVFSKYKALRRRVQLYSRIKGIRGVFPNFSEAPAFSRYRFLTHANEHFATNNLHASQISGPASTRQQILSNLTLLRM